jgi:hypothetical protein
MAVWSIVRFKVLSNYKIDVSFADGTTGWRTSLLACHRVRWVTDSTRYVMKRYSQGHPWSTAR